MKRYSDFVDRLFLHGGLLEKLVPTQSLDPLRVRAIRETADLDIAGGATIGDPATFALVRGGLFYCFDAIDEAHVIFQKSEGDLGAYWHGMVHRREGDFDNARYWFRRTGVLPVFDAIHQAASENSALMARQSNWDPYAFTGQCEQARFGDYELTKELSALQRVEFEILFDYCWRKSALS